MSHYHIYSFCGQPGCKDKPYHANTENLVSPQIDGKQSIEYFNEHLIEDNEICNDDMVIMRCRGKCPNENWMWVYIRQSNPLTLAFRPNHYKAKDLDRPVEGSAWTDDLWEQI